MYKVTRQIFSAVTRNWSCRNSPSGHCAFTASAFKQWANSTKEEISSMKPKQIVISILAVVFVFPLLGSFAQQAAHSGSIEVITTFDYPGTGILTLPQKINERGDIVGEFIDSSGVVRGFV